MHKGRLPKQRFRRVGSPRAPCPRPMWRGQGGIVRQPVCNVLISSHSRSRRTPGGRPCLYEQPERVRSHSLVLLFWLSRPLFLCPQPRCYMIHVCLCLGSGQRNTGRVDRGRPPCAVQVDRSPHPGPMAASPSIHVATCRAPWRQPAALVAFAVVSFFVPSTGPCATVRRARQGFLLPAGGRDNG